VNEPEDAEDLVDLRVAWEERLAHDHLGKDAADRPHVERCRVVPRAEQDLGRAVPERDDLQGNRFIGPSISSDVDETEEEGSRTS
jgi:hypothetical protein